MTLLQKWLSEQCEEVQKFADEHPLDQLYWHDKDLVKIVCYYPLTVQRCGFSAGTFQATTELKPYATKPLKTEPKAEPAKPQRRRKKRAS